MFKKVYNLKKENYSFLNCLKELIPSHQADKTKVTFEFAYRICDWLSDLKEPQVWIENEKYKSSFFYQHYMGEWKTDNLKKDPIWFSSSSKCRAVLYWENNSFVVMVRDESKKELIWNKIPLEDKGFMSLQGGVQIKLKTQDYKDCKPSFLNTTLFDRLKLPPTSAHTYQRAEDPTQFASVVVY